MVLPQKVAQASVQTDLPAPQKAPQPSLKDIGFLDPSLQHDFPELCLFHNIHAFCDRIQRCRSEFDEAAILELLLKCLRGEALTWFRSQSECQDLAVCLLAMRSRFPQASQQAPQSSQEAPQASSQAAPQEAPPQLIEYHHCKLCNASFSSMARLMRHTQEDVCNKPSCRHCETVFSSKNQLHRHLREECQKQRHRSSPSFLPGSSPSPSPLSEENRVLLPPLPPSPPPIYRLLSPPPLIYKVIRNVLTVEDLYARYAPRYLKMDDLFRIFR